MRILDDNSDKNINKVTLVLTKEEAIQLRGDLNQLIADPKVHHTHCSSENFQKEITVCIYDVTNLQSFHPRIIKLIKEDV